MTAPTMTPGFPPEGAGAGGRCAPCGEAPGPRTPERCAGAAGGASGGGAAGGYPAGGAPCG